MFLSAVPAVAVAVIPAPVVPIPVAKQFGEPSFVKVIKTTTHNANNVALRDLVSDDKDGDGFVTEEEMGAAFGAAREARAGKEGREGKGRKTETPGSAPTKE